MAFIAYADSPWAMLVPAALAVPVLISLKHIRAEEIDFARASGAAPTDADRPERAGRAALLKNRRLLIFATCAALFQLASASIMPLLSGMLAYEGKRQAAPLIAALIVVPQLLVGLLAPWVGRSAEEHGRKPLAAPRVRRPPHPRGALCVDQQSACLDNNSIAGRYYWGGTRANYGSDHRRCYERYWTLQSCPRNVRHRNVGAALSPTLTGLKVDQFGRSAGFVSLAAEGLVALLILAVFLPDTKGLPLDAP
jgi:hypothetical protein